MARLIDLAKLVFVRPFAWIMGKVSDLFRKTPTEPEVPVSGDAVVQQAISRSCNAAVLTVSGALVLILVGVVLLTLSVKPKRLIRIRRARKWLRWRQGCFVAVGGERSQETTGHPE